ncbi:hypothetical protein [Actinophytocola sp. KF-1]
MIIKKGCPLAFSFEGSDHVQFTCGRARDDAFEFVVERDALGAFEELVSAAVKEMNDREPQ